MLIKCWETEFLICSVLFIYYLLVDHVGITKEAATGVAPISVNSNGN